MPGGGPAAPGAAPGAGSVDAGRTLSLMGDRFRQEVPRPALVRRGPPPPWAGNPALAGPIRLSAVRAALTTSLPPGADAAGAAEAAVLLPLFEEEGETRVLFIRRAATLGRDPGHVALPGGRIEPGEAPLAAALRESEEEIGLPREQVEPLAFLPLLERPRSGERVLPIVGALATRPRLVLNPGEVEAVLEVGLAELAADGVAWEERWGAAGRPVLFFSSPALGDDLLWGVTARIAWSLLALLGAV